MVSLIKQKPIVINNWSQVKLAAETTHSPALTGPEDIGPGWFDSLYLIPVSLVT